MRKLKLLFAIAALMLGVGGASAQQQDVTATYLTNANFSVGTPIDNGICTYGKDMAGNNTTYYGAQEVSGWTSASVGASADGYEGNGLAGGIFAYGGTPFLGGSGYTAPAEAPAGSTGNTLGLMAVWGNKIQYTKDVTLPAGSYTLRFNVYNATSGSGNSSGIITTNLFGFVPNEGTAYYAPNKTFAIGQWSTIAVTFKLTAETAGKISMGFVGPDGSGAMPHLFVDNVKILKNTYYEDVTNKVNKTAWTGASDGYQGGSINTARKYGDKAIGRKIYQTVSGLSNGTYEVVLYSISQKEWNGTLASDAGDVAYVFAEGNSELKEWINARARNSYPGDDKLGIYTISGVEVTDGTLTIGMGLAQANLTEWHHVQIHSLIYTKNLDLSGVISAYETALANAQAAAAKTDPMQTSLMVPLNEAISTYGNVDRSDGDAMETATAALSAATDAVNHSIAAYANAKAYFDEAEPILDNTNFYTAASYATYYTGPKAKYDARTLTTEEANALIKMGGWHSANTIDDILLSSWTLGGEQCANYDKSLYINTWSTEGDIDGSNFKTPFFEYWVSSGSVAANTIQGEMTGLIPNGLYKIDVWARLQKSSDFAENSITLQVGEGAAIDLTKATQIGSTNLYADVFTASGNADADGKLTVKIVVTENSGCSWLSFKDVKYAELEDERIPLAEQLVTAVAEAKSLSTTLVIPDPAKTALFNVADKYQDFTYTSLETAAEFTAAINEVNSAIAIAQSMVAPYAAWKTLKSQADALVAVSTNDTDKNTTLASVISAQNTSVETATTTETITSATTTLKGAMVTYITTAQPTNDECFDLTFMIVNQHFTEGTADNPTGWTVNYPAAPEGQWGGNKELRASTHNFEAYHKQFTLSQTIPNLPKGTYKVTLQGFARHDGNDKDKTNLFCGIVNQPIKEISEEYSTTSLISGKPAMGDTNGEANSEGKYRPNGMSASYYYFQETNPMTNQPFYTSEVQTLIANDGDLTIGFKCETWSDWVIWDNFHLYYYGSAIAVTIDENETSSVYDEDIENANITLKRTFKSEVWNTIALPFDLTDAETKTAFGSDTEVATFSETPINNGYNDSNVTFDKAADASISANTPVLLKTSTTENTFTFNGKTIKAGEAKVAGTNFDFVGTYAASTTIAEGDYFIGDNQLWKSEGTTTIKGTRAYFKAKTAGARITDFRIGDGETTGIENIDNGAKSIDNATFDLQGRKVTNVKKGLYIKNSKKVVVR